MSFFLPFNRSQTSQVQASKYNKSSAEWPKHFTKSKVKTNEFEPSPSSKTALCLLFEASFLPSPHTIRWRGIKWGKSQRAALQSCRFQVSCLCFWFWRKVSQLTSRPLLSPKQSELVSTFCEFLWEGERRQRLLHSAAAVVRGAIRLPSVLRNIWIYVLFAPLHCESPTQSTAAKAVLFF